MHELSIAEGLLEVVNETIRTHHLGQVSRIKLKVGLLTAVVPEALEFCFQALVKDTPLENAKLDIEIVPVRGRCKGCGERFLYETNEAFCFLCPKCGHEIEILTGRDLTIEEIEGEEEKDENTSS